MSPVNNCSTDYNFETDHPSQYVVFGVRYSIIWIYQSFAAHNILYLQILNRT
jgi:hypothetical protein